MLAVIKLEAIGDDYFAYKRSRERTVERRMTNAWRMAEREGPCWVARITGLDRKYGLAREFVHGQRDYAQANSVGSRGVFIYYPLRPGVYEVHERLTWAKSRRYFVRVEGTEYYEITQQEVIECLNADSASAS